MSDLGFKGTYALSNDSPIESSNKSAGAPATKLSDVKLVMGMSVEFQDSFKLQQSKTTHEMAEMKIELLFAVHHLLVTMIKQRFQIAKLTTDEHECSLVDTVVNYLSLIHAANCTLAASLITVLLVLNAVLHPSHSSESMNFSNTKLLNWNFVDD